LVEQAKEGHHADNSKWGSGGDRRIGGENDSMMKSTYNLPENLADDIAGYEQDVRRFLDGDLSAGIFKARRVPRGVYEQRTDGTYMLRVRVAGGVLACDQAAALSRIAGKYSNGLLHVTTRQDVQFHDLRIADTPAVMCELLDAGLTSKGGGGNTVRNVTACPYAGICPQEAFDVTPCAQAVTEYLIALPGSYNLPRKYKIAFSGCASDCALAQISDLGFIAETREGQPGFRVVAGGGMGTKSRIADELVDWQPAREIIRTAEAVRRLFDRLGDRTDKHRARLRFVFERIGLEAFKGFFENELDVVTREGVPAWEGEPELNREVAVTGNPPAEELRHGIRVIPQRQTGYVAVPLHLPMGFVNGEDFAKIGSLAEQFSAEGGLRTSRKQNLLIRYVKEADLPALAQGLEGVSIKVLAPVALDRFVACAGASTCRLGICLARGASQACAEALDRGGLKRKTLEALGFHINGCSNACGQQPAAAIGFYGAAQRSDNRLVPSYVLTLGGHCNQDGAQLGRAAGRIPAAALPGLVVELATDFETNCTHDEAFLAYYQRRGHAYFEELAGRHTAIPTYAENPAFYRDLGAEEDFSLAGRGAGECGAGVFEVIQNDLASAHKAQAPFDILLPAARALLITRGVDAQDADTVLREFEKHFIDSGLVDAQYRALMTRARGFTQGWDAALDDQSEAIRSLLARVELLYSTLDASLAFHPPEEDAAHSDQAEPAGADASAVDIVELDLKGVPCPTNFMKAKLALEPLAVGTRVALTLDDGDPAQNVPVSLRSEGHEVEDITDLKDGYWRVVIRKGANH